MFKIRHPNGWVSVPGYMLAKIIFDRYAKKGGVVRLYHRKESGLTQMEVSGKKRSMQRVKKENLQEEEI